MEFSKRGVNNSINSFLWLFLKTNIGLLRSIRGSSKLLISISKFESNILKLRKVVKCYKRGMVRAFHQTLSGYA